MYEFSKNTPNIKSMRDTPENRAFELNRKANSVFRRYMEKTWENIKEENKIPIFIEKVKDNIAKFVPEATEAPEKIDLALNFLQKKEDLIDKATEITIRIFAQHLSLEEIESRFRENYMQLPGIQPLSRILTFIIRKESKTVSLHIPITFFENTEFAIESFKEGLQTLAKKLTNDPELKNIIEITGDSPLVKEKSRLLTSLGFTVAVDKDGKATEKAKISREKLLEIYGK